MSCKSIIHKFCVLIKHKKHKYTLNFGTDEENKNVKL